MFDDKVQAVIDYELASLKYPMLFVTVSGAHLYGFPSPDSDYDLRGSHVLPKEEVLGLKTPKETIDFIHDGEVEVDLVSHDVKKFFSLLLKKNGYVLEQLYSPLIIKTTAEHAELKEIAKGCVTRNHVYHYKGFALNEWKLFNKEVVQRVKPLLYVFRVLLTGIHLMRTGKIEANLNVLNQEFKLSYLDELIEQKRTTKEQITIGKEDLDFYESEFRRLEKMLIAAGEQSNLPADPTAKDALSDLLVRLRLGK